MKWLHLLSFLAFPCLSCCLVVLFVSLRFRKSLFARPITRFKELSLPKAFVPYADTISSTTRWRVTT